MSNQLTIEGLSRELGFEVPELYLTIAQHFAYGVDAAGIAEVLGVTTEEVLELQLDEEFKQVQMAVSAHHAKRSVEMDSNWDAIEQRALGNLATSLQYNKDPELNLRVAAVANKAVRRHRKEQRVLDPSHMGTRVQITLTHRMIEKLQGGKESAVSEREFSIKSLNHAPTFEEVDELLGVAKAVGRQSVQQEDAPATVSDVIESLLPAER